MGDRVVVGEEGAVGGQGIDERCGRGADDLLEGVVLLEDHDQVVGRGA
jgi:hypothetical protein